MGQIVKDKKGGLTTLLMRGSSAIRNFSMLVFRITSVITLQGGNNPSHHGASNQRARRTNRRDPIQGARGEDKLTREGRSSVASARRGAGAERSATSSHRARLLLRRRRRHRRRAAGRRPPPAASSATSPAATRRLVSIDRRLVRLAHATPRPNRGLTYLRAVQEAQHAFASMEIH
jgi:hypothetical protein